MSFLEFQPIAPEPSLRVPGPKGAQKGRAAPPAKGPTTKRQTAASKATQNLLVHIPGEASGLYLMGMDALATASSPPSPSSATVVGVLALVLLVVVRWLAGASVAVMATTIGAFLVWMAVFDNGFLSLLGLGIPNNLGVVVALFYSTLITVLGSAGKLK